VGRFFFHGIIRLSERDELPHLGVMWEKERYDITTEFARLAARTALNPLLTEETFTGTLSQADEAFLLQ
jgi:hypothetical protein